LNVKEHDAIVAINGTRTLSVTHPRELLRHQMGQQVRLRIAREGIADPFPVIVEPIGAGAFRDLQLSQWEYTRRMRTEEAGDGEIGYFHMRAMTGGNFGEFVKGFYPVFNRKGLIIDMRRNFGGNIDSWILGRLLRQTWMYWQGRTGKPYRNMQYAFNGHMVVLIDEYTISDGEAFSAGFRRLGLGPLIGTQTWGGGIWLRSANTLVDNGIARSPEFGVFGLDGQWLIEGDGLQPDIRVDNLPHATFHGHDAQLERAIEYLREKIKEEPVELPEHPPYPDKSFDRTP
jgi:tricorn protease